MDLLKNNAKEYYAQKFDPEEYKVRISDRDGGKFQPEMIFFAEALESIFSQIGAGPSKKTTLLDIGSGPTVHNIVSACQQFTHIVLSDYVESSREEVKNWLEEKSTAIDWSKLLHIAVQAKVKGDVDFEAQQRRIEADIRRHVKDVIHCDFLADQIVAPEYRGPYDVVLTSLAMESAAPDYPEFKKCLRKVNPLVKSGGYLVMKGFIKGSPWKVGDHVFPYLCLSKEEIDEAVVEAGFEDIDWKLLPKQDKRYEYQFESCYCLSCRKTKEI